MNDPTGATRFARIRAHLESVRVAAGLRAWTYEFLLFGFKQGWACLFGGLLLALMLGTRLVWPAHAPIARYDALVSGDVRALNGLLAKAKIGHVGA